jgi:hypothetical protein
MRYKPLLCTLCACWTAGLLGNAAAAAPVRALTIEGNVIEGDWMGMQGDKLKLSVEGKETLLEPAQIMGLHWVGATSRPSTAPAATAPGEADNDWATVHLADGSCFPARVAASDRETLKLQTDLVPELELPLSRLAAVRFSADGASPAAKPFGEALAARDPTEDTLIVAHEGKVNTLRGVLESLQGGGAKFKWRGRSVNVDRSRIFGLVLATGAGAPDAPPVRCILNNGSIWAGRLTGGDADTIQLQLAAGPTLEVSTELLENIRFKNDQLQFLSDIEPANYEFTPWAATRWPYRKDRSAANRPLRVGGQVFDRGIGMHSRSVLTYTLDGSWRQFAATVGIDDAVGSRGNVVFRLRLDGREAFDSGPVTGRDEPRTVLLELNGAKTLQLEVDFGEELDVGDQANWCSARLIK